MVNQNPELLRVGSPQPAPRWAILENELMCAMELAVDTYIDRYTRKDGTLVWRSFWPGMDGADDAYESFQNFPLLYALGADERILTLAHRQWDSVTWQWTEHGQVEREFFKYYDWMHHGEGNLFLYYMGLADPSSLKFTTRSERFAAFYTGDDRLASNYDRQRRLIRAPISGSAGPRFSYTAEDWTTHRAVLDGYLPPFEDMPGIPFGNTCPWSDDRHYATILDFLNRRMARGDVPLNLNATSLVTHAYLHTGAEKYRAWVLEYLAAWEERTRLNGGVIPDNVDLEGRIGGNMDGKWWGGYYGWRWPHGAMTVVEPLLNAGCNALLLTGEDRWLDLVRSQTDLLYSLGHPDAEGAMLVPHKHFDSGWGDWRRENTKWPVYLWSVTQNPADAGRIGRLSGREHWGEVPTRLAKGNRMEIHPWYHYLSGGNPDFPVQTLEANLAAVRERVAEIEQDTLGHVPAEDIHYWQEHNPVVCEALVQLMLGGPTNIYHGGLLLTALRYFYAGRPGLPRGVGALVSQVTSTGVTVSFYNAADQPQRFTVQGGAYGEHRLTAVRIGDGNQQPLQGLLELELTPHSGVTVQIAMQRFAGQPSYLLPGQTAQDRTPGIVPREG